MATTFAAIIVVLQVEWQQETDTRGIQDIELEVIIGDIMIFTILLEATINCLEVVLDILSFYRCILKLQKTRFLGPVQYFVGINIWYKVNVPEDTKQPKQVIPVKSADLGMFIVMFGFYSTWITYYKVITLPLWELLKEVPPVGMVKQGPNSVIGSRWKTRQIQILQ